MLTLREYYKPEHLTDMSELLTLHLLNKHEHKKGILMIKRFGTNNAEYFGMNDRTILQKSLAYYNSLPKTSACWFYTEDLIKRNEICPE